MGELRTDETLLQALREAASRKLSAEELHQQRVSFIMGSLKQNSGVTRAMIEDVLAAQAGRRAA